jgi:FkbM family methyltransferase
VRDWPRTYRRASQFGLRLLPDGLRLDGLIVDIGANVGDFTAAIRALEPKSRVVCFEPGSAAAGTLRARFADDPKVVLDQRALSDREGTATLNMSGNGVFASLLAPQASMHGLYPEGGTEVVGQEEVLTTTLDFAVSEPVRVLKIDAQGHEIPLLHGATRTLARADAVLIEVNFVSHYEGDALFFDVDRFMTDVGFVLSGLSEPERHVGRALWSDACYVPMARSAHGTATENEVT